jgi:esterase/lipase superfamily enzyme
MLPTLLRHPGVSHLFSMSGAFNIKNFLDGFHNDDVFYNSPEDYLYGLDDPELWKMDIVLGTSNWDICFDAKLSKVLSERNVHHWFDIRQDRVMTGRYGRKCFLTYPESNFLDSGIQYERHNII